MNQKLRIVILGSSGFIGAHLVSWLKSNNYFVVGVDRLNVYDRTLGLNAPDQQYQLTLPNERINEILKEIKPDIVINASGPSSVANSIYDPNMDFQGSVNVNFSVLESLRKSLPECKFILFSSAAVYGNPSVLPIKETAALQPISPYGYHKLISETIVHEYYSVFGIRANIVRIFSAYGPGLRKQLLWDIYQKAIREEQVTLFGTGEETRDFININDIGHSIQLILERGSFCADVYNIAGGSEITIRELSKMLLSALGMGKKETVFTGEIKSGDPQKWCADIKKIIKLGYSPSNTLEQGIVSYAKWINILNGNN